MTLNELRERVRSLSGIRQTELSPNDRLNDLLNEAYLELAGIEDWPWLYVDLPTVSVSASEAEVDLPVEFRTFTGVLFDGQRLHQVTLADLDEAGIDEEGDPYAWARLSHDRIKLIPTPTDSGTLRLRGYSQVSRLEADGDEPVFDPEFHHLLAYVAAARLLIEEADDSERAELYADQVRDGFANMRTRYLKAHERMPLQLGARAVRRRQWRL